MKTHSPRCQSEEGNIRNLEILHGINLEEEENEAGVVIRFEDVALCRGLSLAIATLNLCRRFPDIKSRVLKKVLSCLVNV